MIDRVYASTDCMGGVGETIKRKGRVSQACLGKSTSFILDIHKMVYWQRQNRIATDQYQMTISLAHVSTHRGMRNRKEVFFPCRRVLPLLWTLYRRRLSHHFLQCKVITFLAFVIQSEIQRNMISVISFNSLGKHAKGEDVFSAVPRRPPWSLSTRAKLYFVYFNLL